MSDHDVDPIYQALSMIWQTTEESKETKESTGPIWGNPDDPTTSITHFLEQLSSFFHGDNPTSQTSKPPKPPNLQTSKPQNLQNLENSPAPGSATVNRPRHTLLLSIVDGLPSHPTFTQHRKGDQPPRKSRVSYQPTIGGSTPLQADDQIIRNFQTNALLRIIPT